MKTTPLTIIFCGALFIISAGCNRQPENSGNEDAHGKNTTTSYIESTGTTGATDYNNDSAHHGTETHNEYSTGMDSSARQR